MKFNDYPVLLKRNYSKIQRQRRILSEVDEFRRFVSIHIPVEYDALVRQYPTSSGYSLTIIHRESKLCYSLDSISHLTPMNIHKELDKIVKLLGTELEDERL